MPRPRRLRQIHHTPDRTFFKPVGVPLQDIEEIILSIDELEALRLTDLVGLNHEESSLKMNISRPTFTRTLESARKKVSQFLIAGSALRIEGGDVQFDMDILYCPKCGYSWKSEVKDDRCPQCNHPDPVCINKKFNINCGHHCCRRGRKYKQD